MPRVLLRPEEGEELIAAMKATRPGHSQIGKERNTLRLREDRVEIIAVWVTQDERSERPKLYHMGRVALTCRDLTGHPEISRRSPA
jgi:hypothetical protein